MCGAAGEERAGRVAAERRAGEPLAGKSSRCAEGRHGDRVAREAQQRAGDSGYDLGPVAHGGGKERAPGAGVGWGELRGGFVERVFEQRDGAVVEGMRHRGGRLDPAQAVLLQRKRQEKRRSYAKRIDRGAEIVMEARQVTSPVEQAPPICALRS